MDIWPAVQEILAELTPTQLDELYLVGESGLDGFAADLATLYQERIPAYRPVDRATIEAHTRSILRFVLDQVRGGRLESSDEVLANLTRTLAAQGLPLAPLALCLQLGARRIVAMVMSYARSLQGTPPDLSALADLGWAWATHSAATIHAVQEELAVTDATSKSDFVRKLVTGAMQPATLTIEASTYRLSLDAPYAVACLRVKDADSHLLSALRSLGGTTERPVFDAVVEGNIVALLPQRPTALTCREVIGIGPSVTLANASESFRQAETAASIARRHGISGIVDLPMLGPRPLLDAARPAAEALDERLLGPLRGSASGRDLIHTAAAYLHHNRRIDDTAAALHLHRNTVRDRMRRFATRTGLDLEDTTDLVTTWWLLGRTDPATAGE